MLKPVGSACNMHCAYCYYLEKAQTLDSDGPRLMTVETLERFIQQYMEAQTQQDVLFIWHGGEPMLRSIDFYRKAVSLQGVYARGRHVDNCIQTNGTLIDDAWCRFLKEHHWLVGVSIDGPEALHDHYRRSREGENTFEQVMRGIRLLNQYGVEWNAMATVNRHNAEYPLEFYRFFKRIGCRYVQFTPVVERTDSQGRLVSLADGEGNYRLTSESVTPEQWGRFCCHIFDEWVKQDIGSYFVQLFDATLANWCGVEPGVCSMADRCGYALAMEPDGSVYSCDHFVFPSFRLGNIHTHTLTEMGYGKRQDCFRMLKATCPAECRQCAWHFACHGECPKNRFVRTPAGEPGLNYLCRGYQMFFRHVAPYMERMRQCILQGGSAADIMRG